MRNIKKFGIMLIPILLFSFIFLVGSALGSDLYVDNDADPEWYDATHVETIQEGIDNSSNGDNVYVYNGTYITPVTDTFTYYTIDIGVNININKSINLIGNSSTNTTLITDKDDAVSGQLYNIIVTTDNVNVSGFTLLLDTNPTSYVGGLRFYCVNNSHAWDIVSGNDTKGGDHAIHLERSTNCTIKDCETNHGLWYGICLATCSNCLVEDCYIHNKTWILSSYSSGLAICDWSNNCTAKRVIVENCIGNGFIVYTETNDTVFEDCKSIDNTAWGLVTSEASINVLWTGGEITGSDIGVQFETTEWTPLIGSNCQIHYAKIYDNTVGVQSDVLVTDATYNYWGHYTGCYHPTENPLGRGNRVSDNVLFDPWYTDEGLTNLFVPQRLTEHFTDPSTVVLIGFISIILFLGLIYYIWKSIKAKSFLNVDMIVLILVLISVLTVILSLI